MARTGKTSVVPRFKVGDKIRVKPGVNDPDFPDLPLGGWTGTITEVLGEEGQFHCVFRVDQRTLANLHPIFAHRSEIEGLDYDFMGLGEEEIEPDDGVPMPIEQPTSIVPRPLAMDDQDDRVRAVFGLTHDDFLPEVTEENQHIFGRYLLTHLTFPFRAQYRPGRGRSSNELVPLIVTGLYDLDQYSVEERYGLIGVGKEPGGPVEFLLAEIEGIKDKGNRILIEDYADWLVNS